MRAVLQTARCKAEEEPIPLLYRQRRCPCRVPAETRSLRSVFVGCERGRSSSGQTQGITTGRGALGAGIWGLLLGTLFGGPLGGLIGGAASAGGGALLAKLVDTGIKDDRIAALRESVPPGRTALALLVSHLSVAD